MENLESFQDEFDAPAGVKSVRENAATLAFLFVMCSVFVLSVFFNGLYLVIYLRRASLRNISNKFITNLTLGNLSATCVLVPISVGDFFLTQENVDETIFGPYLCNVFSASTDFVLSATIYATSIVALDRYFAIVDPLHYHMILNKRRSVLLMVSGWTLTLIMAFLSGISGHQGSWNACELIRESYGTHGLISPIVFSAISGALSFLAPFALLSAFYWKIYGAARGNSERTRRSSLCTSSLEAMEASRSVSRTSSTKSTASSQIVTNIRRRISNASLFLYKEEARAAIISLVVVLLFITCWLPYYAVQILSSVFAESYGKTTTKAHFVVVCLALSNTLVSPYIYIYRSKRIAKEACKFLQCGLCRTEDQKKRRVSYHQLSSNLLSKLLPQKSPLKSQGCPSFETPVKVDCKTDAPLPNVFEGGPYPCSSSARGSLTISSSASSSVSLSIPESILEQDL